jgi:hypothetical protein
VRRDSVNLIDPEIMDCFCVARRTVSIAILFVWQAKTCELSTEITHSLRKRSTE